MNDIPCPKCGEPWDSYGINNGDMTKEESGQFRKGEGCPSCHFGERLPLHMYLPAMTVRTPKVAGVVMVARGFDGGERQLHPGEVWRLTGSTRDTDDPFNPEYILTQSSPVPLAILLREKQIYQWFERTVNQEAAAEAKNATAQAIAFDGVMDEEPLGVMEEMNLL